MCRDTKWRMVESGLMLLSAMSIVRMRIRGDHDAAKAQYDKILVEFGADSVSSLDSAIVQAELLLSKGK